MQCHHGSGVIKMKTGVLGRLVFMATPIATFFISLDASISTAETALWCSKQEMRLSVLGTSHAEYVNHEDHQATNVKFPPAYRDLSLPIHLPVFSNTTTCHDVALNFYCFKGLANSFSMNPDSEKWKMLFL